MPTFSITVQVLRDLAALVLACGESGNLAHIALRLGTEQGRAYATDGLILAVLRFTPSWEEPPSQVLDLPVHRGVARRGVAGGRVGELRIFVLAAGSDDESECESERGLHGLPHCFTLMVDHVSNTLPPRSAIGTLSVIEVTL